MKHLLVLLIFISVKNGLSAQVTDSTHTDSLNNTMNDPSRTDTSSAHTMNAYRDSANNSSPNSTNNMNNNSMNNTTGTMNNMNNSNSTNNMNSNGMSSMTGANTYAALPVRESYVPDDILSKIKSKYGNGTVIYDITAIRAAMLQDSSMMQQNGGMRTDSSMTNTSNNNSDSAMARNSNMMQNSSMAMTPKYDYLVRTLANGTLQSEWVGDDGTTAITPGEMNKQ